MGPQEETFLQHLSVENLVFYPRNVRKEGYAEYTVHLGELKYTNIRSLLARFFIGAHASQGRIPNWRNLCVGINSSIRAGRRFGHVPMFDFDGKNIRNHLKKRVKVLQENHNLGDAWVYETKRGFHVYFFTDSVGWDAYLEALGESQCCPGFQKAAKRNGYGTLRVSAKFTSFDIKLEYILRSEKRHPRRMVRKAHVVQELVRLGQECGTHFASLFPQWASFQEDEAEWKPMSASKKRGAKAEVSAAWAKIAGENNPCYMKKTVIAANEISKNLVWATTTDKITFDTGTVSNSNYQVSVVTDE